MNFSFAVSFAVSFADSFADIRYYKMDSISKS